jgi:hypothetical protein
VLSVLGDNSGISWAMSAIGSIAVVALHVARMPRARRGIPKARKAPIRGAHRTSPRRSIGGRTR